MLVVFVKAEIVLSPLHHNGVNIEVCRLVEEGDVFEIDLFLKVFCSG